MHWLIQDTIENPYFFKGVLSVEQDLPFEEVCQFMTNQISYEQGRLFNTYLKSIGRKYTDYLTNSGKIKREEERELIKVVRKLLDELSLRGFDLS